MKEEVWESSISRLNQVVSEAPIVFGGFVPMAGGEDPICICLVPYQRNVPLVEEVGVELAEHQQFVVEIFCRLIHVRLVLRVSMHVGGLAQDTVSANIAMLVKSIRTYVSVSFGNEDSMLLPIGNRGSRQCAVVFCSC